MNNRIYTALVFLVLCFQGIVNAADWKPVEDPALLRELFSDSLVQATLKDGVKAEANYNADGTGELRAWGDT